MKPSLVRLHGHWNPKSNRPAEAIQRACEILPTVRAPNQRSEQLAPESVQLQTPALRSTSNTSYFAARIRRITMDPAIEANPIIPTQVPGSGITPGIRTLPVKFWRLL